jgi:signal transduction histidine kinase
MSPPGRPKGGSPRPPAEGTPVSARLWPGTLAGRVALILLLAVGFTQLVGVAWLLAGRAMLARGLMIDYLGPDVAAAVAVLEHVPAAERAGWLPRLARSHYSYRLGPAEAGLPDDSRLGRQVRETLARALGEAHAPAVQRATASDARLVQLRLRDGSPLSIELRPVSTALPPALYAALLLQLVLVVGAGRHALRHATRSLGRLADAAQAADPERAGAPLPVEGPAEVARVATAFNAMQQRVARHHADRSRWLAAISHDLQTPLTRMRLRADLLEDGSFKDKSLRDLLEMQALVEQGIAYARSAHAAVEPLRRVDLLALLDGLACDHVDSGHDVRLAPAPAVTLQSRPQALRRLVGNLVDNAVKFSGSAELQVRTGPGTLEIVVRDHGPGVPDDQLAAVKQPFHRVENSRNRDSGGSGLGLAIADELAQVLGGTLRLVNRPGGGLDAVLELPGSGATLQ